MDDNKVSCMHYPTTVVLVDDNKSFLENMRFNLADTVLCMTYSDPEKALKYVKHKMRINNEILDGVMDIDIESEGYSHYSNRLPVQYNISSLYQHLYKKDLFSEVSVIVVDYDMPNMNGEKICAELKNSPVKIIMLTGKADELMAVKLFNAGLIDKFIVKGQPRLDHILKESILDMQNRYFHELTDSIFKGLAINKDTALGDPIFTNFFNTIYQNLSVSSYYLIDLSGSFLFLDNKGSPTWLVIKSGDELREIASELKETGVSPAWIEQIRKGERVPYISDQENYFNSQESFLEGHWYPAQQIEGNKKYSYTLLKDLKNFPLDKGRITSFNDYLERFYSI